MGISININISIRIVIVTYSAAQGNRILRGGGRKFAKFDPREAPAWPTVAPKRGVLRATLFGANVGLAGTS